MLTLKAPIQLHTAQPLTVGTDAFCERIRGNYGLLGAHFTPKDLLFFMTAPPELPEELGGMTTLVNQQNQVDVRSISMDVVNNVVNRILLDGTEHFTYQDQVYITTVLNRLGITQVSQFMEQVRRLRVENESTVQMTKLYRDEVARLIERQAHGEPVPALPLPPREDAEQPSADADPQTALSLSILNRLDTARIFQTVHAFQHSWTGGSTTIRNQELRLSEQLRLSNQLSLAEIKQTLYQQPQLELRHHLNVYEAGVDQEAPRNEEEVLSQAAAAVLLSAVDSTVIQVLNRPQYRAEQWMQVKNALWQTAEASLSRFESYHTHPLTLSPRETERQEAWYHYARELLEYQTLHRTLTALPGETPTGAALAAGQAVPPALVWNQTREGDEIDRRTYEALQSETLNRLEQHIAPQQPPRAALHTETLRQAVLLQWEHTLQTQTQKLRETILRRLAPAGAQTGPEVPAPAPTVFRAAEPETAPAEAPVPTPQLRPSDRELRTERERVEHWEHSRETTVPPPAPLDHRPVPQAQTIAPPPPAAPWNEAEVPLIPLTPDEAEKQAPEALVRELERIDHRNRTVLQTLQSQRPAQPPRLPAQPDLQQTMRTALRALEEPETVLRELHETRERRTAQTIHPELTPREALLLEQAQPQERALYEAVLAYQKDPAGALARGLLRPADQAALQAAIWPPAPMQEPPELTHPVPVPVQQELVREQARSVLERMVHIPGPRAAAIEEPLPPPSVRIVHKQAAPDVTEELLEQLTEQRRSEVLRTESHDQVTRQTTHQVDVNQIQQKVVTQTTEDITELVNRTLARQMRTISDQVYRQMEKRLQTERSRRGRL